MSQEDSEAVHFKERWAYGSPALALSLLGIAFYVYIPKYYVDHLGMNLTAMGFMILASRVFDAVIDPTIGKWSDRANVRGGRRSPFIRWGSLPLACCFLLLVVPPRLPAEFLLVYFLPLTFIFFFFWSLVSVPYEALGTELTFDFQERNRLFSTRTGFFVVGTILASVVPEVVRRAFPDPDAMFLALGLLYGPVVVGACWLCASVVRERIGPAIAHSTGQSLVALPRWEDFRRAFQNKPFRILILTYVVSGFGAALPATLIFFFVEHVLGSERGGLFLLVYFAVGFMALPLWVRVAEAVGKKWAWIVSMAINTGAFTGVLALGRGDEVLYGVCVALSGIGLGGTIALPASMQADVIDFEEFRSGQRSEGQFVGIWSVAKKLSEALGAGIAFPMLGLVGYTPGESPQGWTLITLSILYAGVPCLCNLIAMAMFVRYPIDESAHRAMRREIEKRKGAHP